MYYDLCENMELKSGKLEVYLGWGVSWCDIFNSLVCYELWNYIKTLNFQYEVWIVTDYVLSNIYKKKFK